MMSFGLATQMPVIALIHMMLFFGLKVMALNVYPIRCILRLFLFGAEH